MAKGNFLNPTKVNQLMYAAAAVIASEVKEKTMPKTVLKILTWKKRSQKTIKSYRKHLAKINESKKGVPTCRVCIFEKIKNKYKVDKETINVVVHNAQATWIEKEKKNHEQIE